MWLIISLFICYRDLFPGALCDALSVLQRSAHRHKHSETLRILSENLKFSEISEIFSDIEAKPVGSGCCAQVYKGKLKENGQTVAIKVRGMYMTRGLSVRLSTLVMSSKPEGREETFFRNEDFLSGCR